MSVGHWFKALRYSQDMKEKHIRSYMVFLVDEEFVMVLPVDQF